MAVSPDQAERLLLSIHLDAFRRHVGNFNAGKMGVGEDEQLIGLRAALAVEARRAASEEEHDDGTNERSRCAGRD